MWPNPLPYFFVSGVDVGEKGLDNDDDVDPYVYNVDCSN